MSDSHKPISPKQLAANRANAQRSAGPRTAEGKARSARNAYKHGFTASAFSVVRLEDIQELARLKADLVHDYQPVNSQELFAVERIAIAQLALLRVARLEAGLFTDALDEALTADDQPMAFMTDELTHDTDVTRQQNRNYVLAFGFERMARRSNVWVLFLRYQAQSERNYRRAVEEFERLKRLRPELPNEPISEIQPDQQEPVLTPDELNPFGPKHRLPDSPAPAPPPATAPPPPSAGLTTPPGAHIIPLISS